MHPDSLTRADRAAATAALSMLGEASFAMADQERFAALSGDRNPMHMDKLAARRTQAGAPVVHGIHCLLRGLDLLAARRPDLPPIASLKTSFNKLTYVGDTVRYQLSRLSETGAVLDGLIDGTEVFRVSLGFGGERQPPAPLPETASAATCPAEAADLAMAEMEGMSGQIAVPGAVEDFAAAFPAAAVTWGAHRLLALACTTTLVGMVCPGLHSIYSNLTLNACAVGSPDGLCYRVSRVDPRFRLVRLQVEGHGIWGSIDSFVRMPPVAQPAIGDLAGLVARDEFAGVAALVVGGSRGLGELTAKLLAAGGAEVVITYAAGWQDAEACAEAIRAWGGRCGVLAYDVRQPADAQLAALPVAPTQLYYFATPPILRRKSGLLAIDRYAEFHAFYVTGFYDLCLSLAARRGGGLGIFYPSTVFVEQRPAEMTEYAMAKAAGEVLAADIDAHVPGAHVVVSRLPRLPTDQTATIVQAETADPVAVMLPILREMQKPRAFSD